MTDEHPDIDTECTERTADTTERAGRSIAAFDFDGTISQRDTLLGFLVKAGGPATVAQALLANSARLAHGLRSSTARNSAKEQVLGRVLCGRPEDEMIAVGQAYAREVAHSFRPETLAAIRRHHADDHETVIVSASLVYYLRPIASVLGIGDVIGVEMEVGADGRLTGSLARPNVRGEQKAVRLREWIDATASSDRTEVELWAYGDSSGDDALLAMADHPRWMGRRSQHA